MKIEKFISTSYPHLGTKEFTTYGLNVKNSYSLELLRSFIGQFHYPEFPELTEELRKQILAGIAENFPEDLI
jgi:hypothetical protein